MPFTPFHWGPGSLIGLLLFGIFDFPSLLIASVLVDIEPFLVLFLNLDYPLHGPLHSFLVGSIIAILTSIIVYVLKNNIKKLMRFLGMGQNTSFKKILWTSCFGVYIHILLDSTLYTDIKPFYPFDGNPFYGLFSSQQIYQFCIFTLMIAIIIYSYRLFSIKNSKVD